MRELRQGTAYNLMIVMVSSSDHVTGTAGLTLTITASKAGGAFAGIAPAVTDRGSGFYSLALTAANTDTLGDLALHATAAGADPADVLAVVVAQVEADTFARVGAPAGASLAADVAAVQADTDNIQTRLPTALVGGRMDSQTGAMAANTLTALALAADAVAEIADGVWDELQSGHATAGTFGYYLDARVSTLSGGGGGDPWATALPGAYGAGTAGAILGNVVDDVWDEILSAANHNIAGSAGKRLRSINGDFVHGGTAAGGTVNTIVLDGLASSTDGTYDPGLVRITGGTGAGQARLIIQYTGATRTAAVDRDWRPAPDMTSTFEILSFPNVVSSNEGLAQGGGAQSITLNVDASTLDNIYNGQTIALRTGTGQDQSRLITTYNGSTKVATVGVPWAVPPLAGTGYIVIPTGRVSVSEMMPNVLNAAALAADAVAEIADGVWDEALSGHLTAGSTGEALRDAGASAAGTTLSAAYKWDAATSGAVAAGRVAANAADLALATEVRMAENTDDGIAWANVLARVGGGDRVNIQDQNDATRYVIYEALGTGTDLGTYRTFPVTLVEYSGVPLVNNQPVRLVLIRPGATPAVMADAVWDELLSGHAAAGSAGAVLSAAGGPGTLSPAERDAIATALLDLANGVESGETLRQFLRLSRAVLAGTSDETAGTVAFRRKDGTTTAVTVSVIGNDRTSSVVGSLA